MLLALIAFSLFVTLSYACTSDGSLCVSTLECCTRPCFIAVCNRRSDNRTKTCHYIPKPCLIRGHVCEPITGVCTIDLSVPKTLPPTKNSTVKDADMTTTHSPQPQPQNGWFIALIVLVCIAIVAIACVGYMVYKSKNGNKRRPPLYRKNTNQV